MEIFLIKLLQFVLSISLLVLLHEGGHFLAARLFGVRVEKFFIFFDVSIGKWSGKLFSFKPKGGETEYGMGWLPFGGYCKISGMIDESMDTEQMKRDPQPWEFRTKPAWQRLIIMIGGVFVNFVLALFIYSMIMFTWGESYVRMADMSLGMKFNTEAKKLGFKDHDIITGTNIREFKDFNVDVYRDLADADYAEVLRNGKKVRITMPGDLNLLDMVKVTPPFTRPFIPAVVDSVLKQIPLAENSKELIEAPAYKIGLQKGDRILAVNGQTIDSYNEFTEEIGRVGDQLMAAKNKRDSLKLLNINLVVQRANTNLNDTLNAMLTPDLKLGFSVADVTRLYQSRVTHNNYSLLESFPAGAKYGWNVLSGYVNDMKYLFSANGAKNLGGFVTIGSMFPAQWDWFLFWKMTAFFSIILAFMNILPIPALDGGHVLFLLYEIIARRKPSETFMIRAEYVGLTIIILLMLVANLNDILRVLGIIS